MTVKMKIGLVKVERLKMKKEEEENFQFRRWWSAVMTPPVRVEGKKKKTQKEVAYSDYYLKKEECHSNPTFPTSDYLQKKKNLFSLNFYNCFSTKPAFL